MITENPFSLAHASGFTDKQINSFWTDLGSPDIINAIFEPKNKGSKLILGGKGTGKTHLLRYYSYNVTRLRDPEKEGLSIVKGNGYLAVFLRATGVDASRFEASSGVDINWQNLFGVYLELKLIEQVIDALCDIASTSKNEEFDDLGFLNEIRKNLSHNGLDHINSLIEFKGWLINQRRIIDEAVNDAAFTGDITLKPPFSIGSLCLTISNAIGLWHSALNEITLFYLIDEIENFSFKQQQVINTLIRYGENKATFRVTGRQYAIKTYSTLADGEENRVNSEFTKVILDELLLKLGSKFYDFAERLIFQRLSLAGKSMSLPNLIPSNGSKLKAKEYFEDIEVEFFYESAIERLKINKAKLNFVVLFEKTLRQAYKDTPYNEDINLIVSELTSGFPLIIAKLNILLFVKKFKKKNKPLEFAHYISTSARKYLEKKEPGFYFNAYGHYASDLFSQLCRDSSIGIGVCYAGFDTIVKMTSSNPRNLLIILSKIYDVATFRGIDFLASEKISLEIQTEAVLDSARFMYEADTNFGLDSDIALRAVDRLASLLRTARFSMNIPEVSPLALSFSDDDLSSSSKKILQDALNYSLVFEVNDGRADRNSEKIIRKIQLNPMLSPKWALPVSRRGDISLNKEMLAVIFSEKRGDEFDSYLKKVSIKWNSITKPMNIDNKQRDFFE
ncbi:MULTISPECIES: hypothetical protein [unclassified Pantoea]|uniref:ORC-CDC6 family AAA ATPase n=1 Tax=unclassified Pantoea TaxID=2630326 RepID=UPI001232B5ED|nr:MULTISPECIES: hypothetical protein [unclassified Pantoea]KAA6097095.1 hypothetical protein F3I21_17665 [Pantoea sp. B_9]KAA6110453.1 hypothetical protein F3I18_17875 [Pantoea sp. B_10]